MRTALTECDDPETKDDDDDDEEDDDDDDDETLDGEREREDGAPTDGSPQR